MTMVSYCLFYLRLFSSLYYNFFPSTLPPRLVPFFLSCLLPVFSLSLNLDFIRQFSEAGNQPSPRCHCPNMEMPIVPSPQYDRTSASSAFMLIHLYVPSPK
jgi:hypothetical protein